MNVKRIADQWSKRLRHERGMHRDMCTTPLSSSPYFEKAIREALIEFVDCCANEATDYIHNCESLEEAIESSFVIKDNMRALISDHEKSGDENGS